MYYTRLQSLLLNSTGHLLYYTRLQCTTLHYSLLLNITGHLLYYTKLHCTVLPYTVYCSTVHKLYYTTLETSAQTLFSDELCRLNCIVLHYTAQFSAPLPLLTALYTAVLHTVHHCYTKDTKVGLSHPCCL